jgi:hypothetical protein
MPTICKLDASNVWTGEAIGIAEGLGCPVGWTFAEPPVVPQGSVAQWAGLGWNIVSQGVVDAPKLAAKKRSLLAASRAQRYAVETAGFVVSGVKVNTDLISQNKLTGAVALFEKDPTLQSLDWEARPGEWVTVTGPELIAMGIAMGRHIQACYTRSREISDQIAAAPDLASLDSIDINSGWPS